MSRSPMKWKRLLAPLALAAIAVTVQLLLRASGEEERGLAEHAGAGKENTPGALPTPACSRRQACLDPAVEDPPPESRSTLQAPSLGTDTGPSEGGEGERPPLLSEARRLPGPQAYQAVYRAAADRDRARAERAGLIAIAGDDRLEAAVRSLALWGLASIGDLEPCRRALEAPGPVTLRLTAVEMLCRHDPAAAFGLLERAARQPEHPEVREAALRALSHLDEQSVIPLLAEAVRPDEPESLRLAAIEILGRIERPESLAVVLALEPSGEDDKAVLRQARALLSLSEVDPRLVSDALERIQGAAEISETVRRDLSRLINSRWEEAQ